MLCPCDSSSPWPYFIDLDKMLFSSQDPLFVRAVSLLPQPLQEALRSNGLDDPGLLKAYFVRTSTRWVCRSHNCVRRMHGTGQIDYCGTVVGIAPIDVIATDSGGCGGAHGSLAVSVAESVLSEQIDPLGDQNAFLADMVAVSPTLFPTSTHATITTTLKTRRARGKASVPKWRFQRKWSM